MALDMKKYARLASLGALGVSAGALALFGVIAWGSTPTPSGGINGTHAMLAYIGAGVPFAAIIAVHLVYSRQLSRYAKDKD